MDNLLVHTLVVSALGMFLLFLALAFLYGLMYLMTTVLRDAPSAQAQPAVEEQQGSEDREAKLRAAVVAVVLARARREARPVAALPEGKAAPSAPTSPWWALHHGRQLGLDPNARRKR